MIFRRLLPAGEVRARRGDLDRVASESLILRAAEMKDRSAANPADKDLLRAEKDLDWTFLCPSTSIVPGERTGKFRLGDDQLLIGPDGQSRISVEDYAVAMIDELENPKHTGHRFTVGY